MRGTIIAISALSIFLFLGNIPVYSNPGKSIDEEASAALTGLLNQGFHAGSIKTLDELGLEPEDIVPWLIKVIDENEDRFLRIRACEAIAIIGSDAAEAVPVLTEILKAREVLSDWWLVKSAIDALGAIGSPAADSAGPIIYEILVENADYELYAKLPRNPDGVRSYPKGDREVFFAAYNSLKKNGVDPISLLLNELKSVKYSLGIYDSVSGGRRARLMDTVAKFGADAVPYLREVIEQSDDYEFILNCLQVVFKIGPDATDLTGSLVGLYQRAKGVGSDNAGAMQASNAAELAVSALQFIKPDPEIALPFLIELVNNQNINISKAAIWALGGTGDARAVPILIRTLDDDRQYPGVTYRGGTQETIYRFIKYDAAFALGRIGPEAKEAIPKLVEMLPADEFYVPYALGSMGPDAVPAAVGVLLSDDPVARKNAARALSYMGPEAAYAVDNLILLLKQESDMEVKDAAIHAIGSIGRAALDVCVEDPINLLIHLLDDPEGQVRESAAYSLGLFGALAEPALEKLRQLASEDEYKANNIYTVRKSAESAIERIETNWTPKPKGAGGFRPLCPG
jgi:HEAT repeat protein